MAGLIGGLLLTSAPAFASRDVPLTPAAPGYQLVPTSEVTQLLSCNKMMHDDGMTPPPAGHSDKGK